MNAGMPWGGFLLAVVVSASSTAFVLDGPRWAFAVHGAVFAVIVMVVWRRAWLRGCLAGIEEARKVVREEMRA